MSVLLSAEGLSKAYGGVEAVRDVSFELGRGEMLALIGPNGAGKSTCFNLLNGQTRPDAGRVRIGGRDTTGLSPRKISRLGVGRTFQVAATFASMTVRENVQVAILSGRGGLARFGRYAGRADREMSDELLALVGLEAAASLPCGDLSYGDLKRLDLALALSNKPVQLLMDEPTAGMPAAERAALMRLTRQIARERHVGVLFVEHDLDAVFGYSDRVMVMDRGRLIASGTPAAVRENALVRAVYLGTAAVGEVARP